MQFSERDAARFWAKVDKSGGDDACWNWIASCDTGGYGHFAYKGRLHSAHRVAWALERGDIPTGLRVLHQCDNRACVNAKHLFLGTQLDNVRDMDAKGRRAILSGEANPRSKLTRIAVEAIRELFTSKKMDRFELARKFGISPDHIYQIVNRYVWK